MKDLSYYGFYKTDENISEMDHDEYYFEIKDNSKLEEFMKDFNIRLDDFDLEDVTTSEEFSNFDFQLTVYSETNTCLEFGPVYKCETGEFITVDVNPCSIEGLKEYLIMLI